MPAEYSECLFSFENQAEADSAAESSTQQKLFRTNRRAAILIIAPGDLASCLQFKFIV